MDALKKQSGYSFVFSSEDVDTKKKVSVDADDQKVEDVVRQILDGQSVTYEIKGKNIVVRSITQTSSSQQKKTITGTIVDPSGMPVIGANVMVKGTTNGTITDMDGKFSLEVEEGATLQISYIGYANQEIKVGNQKTLSIALKEDAEALDEVVVVGFGTQKKVNLTGAVSNVTSEAFENRSVANVSQALQGAMPGLNITQSQGYLDATPDINIRGVGTIGEGSSGSPLILIDGMEGDMNRLNPQDIESVSVLKDAAASSIYGSRAPFGVIMITTKKGKSGKMSVNYNNSLRWNKAINMPRSLDAYTFATYYNEAATNAGMAGHFSPERMQKIKDFMEGKITGGIDPDPNNPTRWGDLYNYGYGNTDWIDLIFDDTTFAQEHNLSVSGGNEKLQMYASANYLGQDGYIKLNPESNQRISTNLKVTSQFTDWLSLNYGMRFNQIDFEKPTHLQDDQMFGHLSWQSWPTLVAYDPNGYLYECSTHALRLRDGGRHRKKTNETIQQLNFIIEPLNGWKIIGDVNYKVYHERIHEDWQKVYNHDVNGDIYQSTQAGGTIYGSDSYVNEEFTGSKYLNINAYTEYTHNFDSGHNMKVMFGVQSEQLWQDYMKARRLGIIVDGMGAIDVTDGNDVSGQAVPPTVSGKYDKWATAGYFGRLNYDYKGRYLAEVNLRYDGTSRYRANQRWRWFPSFSLGWNMANEAFWESLSNFISTFKLRGSFGLLGNQNTNSWYPTYLIMPIGSSNSSWLVNGSQLNTSSAPGLISTTMGWETVKTTNVGFDANVLNNRLGVSLEWFTRKTEDMIGPAPQMPDILGTPVPKTNNTSLRTNGWELNISWRDRLESGLGYNVSFNLSDAHTKILEYPNYTGTINDYYSGKEMGEIWGYETIGIAKTQEEMDAHLASLPNGGQNVIGNNWAAGDIMYKDLNGDGKIDSGSSTLNDKGDLKVIGNDTPRYMFGLNLGVDWKGFDVSVFFQGVMKRDFFTSSSDFWGASSLWFSSAYEQHMDYFRNDENHLLGMNLDSYYPRPLFGTDKNKQPQSRYLLNASYIRLKNLSIGYTLPQNLVAKWKLQNLRVFVTGENLWTGTGLTDLFDPETIASAPAGMMKYPMSAVYSFGLSVTY
ncbi:MAG TPA: TonB-dependent receptor [Candidatus Parabacteroides faecavium]|nr:TonB-dependent receptor [Candidatus Parabacteroides faecavium]